MVPSRPARCRRADGEDDHHGHRSDCGGERSRYRSYHQRVDPRLEPTGLTRRPNSVRFHEKLRVGSTATLMRIIGLGASRAPSA
ncbi:hypothetical protein Q1695_010571 [Nippostrongylus brasiliensis]|nr:hypothetical protein Q1695_010571 [Nippostrongylus brasiliensis]